MITPDDFRARWPAEEAEAPLVPFPAPVLRPLHLPEAAITFLCSVGLPEQAAPFLAFGPSYLEPLPGSDSLVGIGSDGGEGWVCIERPSGAIALAFPGGEAQFVNSSVAHLAEALLLFQTLANAVFERVGVFAPSRVSPEEAVDFANALGSADPLALAEGSFWRCTYEQLGS